MPKGTFERIMELIMLIWGFAFFAVIPILEVSKRNRKYKSREVSEDELKKKGIYIGNKKYLLPKWNKSY